VVREEGGAVAVGEPAKISDRANGGPPASSPASPRRRTGEPLADRGDVVAVGVGRDRDSLVCQRRRGLRVLVEVGDHAVDVDAARSRRASAAVEAATTTSALRAISTSSLRHGAAPAIATVSPRQSPSRSRGNGVAISAATSRARSSAARSVEAEVGEDRLVDGFKDLEIHS